MATAPLDNIVHAAWRLDRRMGRAFGDPTGQVPVFLPELAGVAREYPVLFTRDRSGAYSPVAITGLSPDEILFVEEDIWRAHTIPACIRKGPLLLDDRSDPGGANPIVHLHLSHPRLVRSGTNGDPLFRDHGGNAPALEDALAALEIIRTGYEPTRALSAALAAHGLIAPLRLSVEIDDTTRVQFDNFHAVLPEAIDALSPAAVSALHGAGFLQPAVLIAQSLGCVHALVARRRARLS